MPLAYWKLDDCNGQSTELGDVVRTSTITHPAFRAVSAACVAGRDLEGILVYSPDQPDYDFSQGLTIAAWINPDAVSRTQSIVRKRLDRTSSFALAIEGRHVVFVVRLANGKLAGVKIPIHAGQFSHIAGTYNGHLLRIYLNGALADETKVTGSMAAGVGPIFIGNDANGRRFQGIVDEVWLNSVAASPETIWGLYTTNHMT